MTLSESALRRLTARRAEVATVSVAAASPRPFDSQDVTAPLHAVAIVQVAQLRRVWREEWRFRKRYSEFRALVRKAAALEEAVEMSCAKQGEAFQAVSSC
ncbi:Kazal-like serine protease inhibitor [Phytophthora cinnamomi]|uniref:Kazal-like serine protease inhibitor n=1 Tax=Phytophthora cinnamomi TaxID=4785 RepID=UPI003559B48A|nr:Kazal-like serine protease inhibitor [Phytophthora cinnamomi]